MVEYFVYHLDHVFYALAGIFLLTDFYLLRKSSPLLFLGIGGLLTGLCITAGLIDYLRVALVMFAGFSAASAGLLWQRFIGSAHQQSQYDDSPETCEDLLGQILPVSARITKHDGRVYYSGEEWLAQLDGSSDAPIDVNHQVEVTRVKGAVLLVRVA